MPGPFTRALSVEVARRSALPPDSSAASNAARSSSRSASSASSDASFSAVAFSFSGRDAIAFASFPAANAEIASPAMSSRGVGDALGSVHAASPLAVAAGRSGDEDGFRASGFAQPFSRFRRRRDAPAAAAAAAAIGTTFGAVRATRACDTIACSLYSFTRFWLWLWPVPLANASSNSRDAPGRDSSARGFFSSSREKKPSRGFSADGSTARNPRDAATGSDRERRRGAATRV